MPEIEVRKHLDCEVEGGSLSNNEEKREDC